MQLIWLNTPSQIYNETNLVMWGNGDLKDDIKGKIVWRENYARMGQTISLAIGEAA